MVKRGGPRSFRAFVLVGVSFACVALSAAEEWRPKERWRGFNLEGYALQGTFSGRIDEQDMRWIRELGFNFVRVMVDYHYLRRDDDWTKPDPSKFGFVDEAIAMGRRNGLHVNLCLSIPPGVDYKVTRLKQVLYDDPKARQALADYWRVLAKRYRGIPNDELTFNLFNEPNTEPKDDEYVRLIAKSLTAIQEEDPERFVIADGLDNGRRPEFRAFCFRNLGQSLHMYEPMSVSHYKAPWTPGLAGEPAWPPQPVSTPLCGDSKPAEARGPIAIRRVPACALRVDVRLVNRRGELYVRADGRELFRRLFVPAPGAAMTNLVARTGGEWAGRPTEPVAVSVPACERLEIGVGSGDWVDVGRLVLTAPDGRRAEIRPDYSFARSLQPRQDVWFAGFGGHALSLDETLAPFTGETYLAVNTLSRWDRAASAGRFVMIGEFGFYNETPHEIGLAWLEDNLRAWKRRGWGWAMWNFRGPFGILDSNRKDVEYVDFHGHKLDKKMLDLLQRY